jgi:hypothetical protein
MFANVTMWVRSKPLNIALLVFMLAGYPASRSWSSYARPLTLYRTLQI